MPKISQRGLKMPASPIRKLVPFAEAAKKRGIKVYHLNIGQPDIKTPEVAIDAVRRYDGKVIEYSHSAGNETYRKALAANYCRQGIEVDHNQILITTGGSEAILFAMFSCMNPGDEIIIPEPFYTNYNAFAQTAGVIVIPITSNIKDGFALPAISEFEKSITKNTKAIMVCNPNNPTGTLVGQAELDAFMSRIPPHVVVVFDEAYIELLQPEDQPDCLKYIREGRNVIVLRTFSKTYGLAGLRLGYGVAPEECIALLQRVRQPFNTSAMAQAAALAALEDDEYVARTRLMMREGLDYFETSFRKMRLDYVPSSANFILVRVGGGRHVFDAMQRAGIIVRSMDPYGLPDHIRITVGTPRQNRKCLSALKTVLQSRGAA